MSLLMKALEKAAKDRGETHAEQAATSRKAELALEPMSAATPAAPKGEPAPRPGPVPPRVTPAAPASPVTAPAAPTAAPARESDQARAATVVQAQSASRPAKGGVVGYLQAHPMVLFSSLAVLVAVGFGVYVYLQIFHPGMLTAQPPVASKGVPPLTQAPPTPGAVPPAPPLASDALLKEAASEAPPPPDAARAKPPATPTAAAEEQPRSTVVVSTGSAEPSLNPRLVQAYAALQAGEIETAEREYTQLLSAEPASIDVLLGLAAIAARKGDAEGATRHYLRILELDPRHALAQSGLIALLGRADPLAAESRLRQLIAREPSAHLYFTLGNLYADQSHWAAAQQSYFQAHHLEPANPDYAFNLAVALEHVSQPKLALGFYRRAVQLAGARGRVNFNLPQARERIGKLGQQVE